MVTWHATTHKTNAEEGGGATGESGSWWDMRCSFPDAENDTDGDFIMMRFPGIAGFVTFTLDLETYKAAELPEVGYNFTSFLHQFTMRVFPEGTDGVMQYGFNSFNGHCDSRTGVIRTSFDATMFSEREANGTVTYAGTIGPAGEIVYTLSLLIVPIAGGNRAKTDVSATVEWHVAADPSGGGQFRLPEDPEKYIEIENKFVAKEHL